MSDSSGKQFVLTGTLAWFHTRRSAALIEAKGGRVISSVSKKTDFVMVRRLAVKPRDRSFDKAQSLGVTVLDEDAFKKML